MAESLGKIVVVGVLDQKGSTNIPMALQIVSTGISVVPLNYRTIIGKYGYPFFANLLLNIVINEKPDLVLICKGNGLQPQLIAEVNKYAKVWIYNMDPRPTIEMCPEVRENARIATFSSCTALDMAEEWAKLGANCFHMFQGVDEEIFRPLNPVKKYKADIALIGSRTPQRDEYKDYLERAGLNVKFYGPGYKKSVVESEFAKVCASSKFMLSIDSVSGMHEHYFSNRLLRYMACGACTLHFDPTGTLVHYFQDDEHIKYFNDPADVIRIINDMAKNPQRIYRIAMNGMDKVLKNYTWQQLMMKLLVTAIPEVMEKIYVNTVSQNESKDWIGRPSNN